MNYFSAKHYIFIDGWKIPRRPDAVNYDTTPEMELQVEPQKKMPCSELRQTCSTMRLRRRMPFFRGGTDAWSARIARLWNL